MRRTTRGWRAAGVAGVHALCDNLIQTDLDSEVLRDRVSRHEFRKIRCTTFLFHRWEKHVTAPDEKYPEGRSYWHDQATRTSVWVRGCWRAGSSVRKIASVVEMEWAPQDCASGI